MRIRALLVASWLLCACDSTTLNGYQAPADTSRGCAAVLPGDIVNARDLGGTPLEVGTQTACGALFRGPPLAPLSASGCDSAALLGFNTVIDLRTADEVVSKPDAACVTDRAKLVSAPLPIPYNVSPVDYIADLNSTASMALAFATLGDETAYPIYFHCTWGRDRTGIVAAVILLALGASQEEVLKEYMLSAATVGAYPGSLRAVLDEVTRIGGIQAYLDTLGVTPEQLTTLRTQLIGPVTPAL